MNLKSQIQWAGKTIKNQMKKATGKGTGNLLLKKATRADGLNQRRPRMGPLSRYCLIAFAYMPRPSLTMASATMEAVCRTTSSVVDPTVPARAFLTLPQTFGSLMESR